MELKECATFGLDRRRGLGARLCLWSEETDVGREGWENLSTSRPRDVLGTSKRTA